MELTQSFSSMHHLQMFIIHQELWVYQVLMNYTWKANPKVKNQLIVLKAPFDANSLPNRMQVLLHQHK
jgi:hypothetical protein